MPRNVKPPVSREQWLDLKLREFDCADDKRDADSLAHRMGKAFWMDFRNRREELRQGGMSLVQAYRAAITEMAEHVPAEAELKGRNGPYSKYQKIRKAGEEYREKRKYADHRAITRSELHRLLAGKESSPLRDIEWVAENLFPGLDVLSLDPEDIPSRSALNLLEWASKNPNEFRQVYDRERVRNAVTAHISLADSGRAHEEVMKELLAAKALIEQEEAHG